MPNFKHAHAQDNPIDETRAEVVGSTNLKDVLVEHGTITGTWFLNGHEFRHFEAANPQHVVIFINEATKATRVTAAIDEDYHLVLTGEGPEPIAIASGYALQRERQRHSIMARNRAQGHAERPVSDDELDQKPDVLELLGLQPTEDIEAARGPEWKPGEPREERADQREDIDAEREYAAEHGTDMAGDERAAPFNPPHPRGQAGQRPPA